MEGVSSTVEFTLLSGFSVTCTISVCAIHNTMSCVFLFFFSSSSFSSYWFQEWEKKKKKKRERGWSHMQQIDFDGGIISRYSWKKLVACRFSFPVPENQIQNMANHSDQGKRAAFQRSWSLKTKQNPIKVSLHVFVGHCRFCRLNRSHVIHCMWWCKTVWNTFTHTHTHTRSHVLTAVLQLRSNGLW